MKTNEYENLIQIAKAWVREEIEVLTEIDKENFGVAVASIITPYDAQHNIRTMGMDDIYFSIWEEYEERDDIEIVNEYLITSHCKTLEEYVRDYDLPIPDREGMIEYLMYNIDEEEYINERFNDILGFIPEQFKYNLGDDEIIFLVCVPLIEQAPQSE